jgi:hypothetical protein
VSVVNGGSAGFRVFRGADGVADAAVVSDDQPNALAAIVFEKPRPS